MRKKLFFTFALVMCFLYITAAGIPGMTSGTGYGYKVYAKSGSTSVGFPESTNSSSSKTITIPDLLRVTSMTVNTGYVSYSQNGNSVNISVSGGSPSSYYTPSQYISSYSYHSGSSLPPSSCSYSSGSYSGTLSIYSVDDKGYGGYETVTGFFSETHDNTYTEYYNKSGVKTSSSYSWGNTNNHPSVPINQDGYSGSIPQTSYYKVSGPTKQPNSDGSYQMVTVWRGYYSGYISKQVPKWFPDYYGNYRGTIYGPSYSYYSYNVTVNYVSNIVPSVSIKTPVQNSVYGEDTASFVPSIAVSDPDGDVLTCKLYFDSNSTPADSKTVSNTATVQEMSFAGQNVGSLSEGSHTMKVTVFDGEATVQATTGFVIDKTAPAIGTVNFSATDTTLTITGSATDSVALHSVPYRFKTGNTESDWKTGNTHTFTGLLPNTTYSAVFLARDAAGHIADKQQEVSTKAQVPVVSSEGAGDSSITIALNDKNPVDTEYQIKCGSQYINQEGELTAEQKWILLPSKRLIVNGLQSNSEYSLSVKARNRENTETAESSKINGYTWALPPQVLQFTNVSQNEITVQWDEIPNAVGYDIEIDGEIIELSNQAAYTLDGLEADTLHQFRVRVRNAGGIGNWSGFSTCSTLIEKPGNPEHIVFTASIRKVELKWDSVETAEAYDVEVDGVVQDNGTSRTYKHSGLEPDSIHKYRVRAKNAGGNGQWSEYTEAHTLPEPPQPPAEIHTTITKNTIQVNWDALPKTDRYEIEVDGFIHNNDSTTEYLHEGLVPLTEHKYRIRGSNAGGTGEWSEYFYITTYPYEPGTPDNLMASASNESITLTWYMSAFASSYEIEIDGILYTETSGTSYEHMLSGLGGGHKYRVRAKNISGVSDWTKEVSMESAGSAEQSVSNVAAIVNTDSIQLSWDSAAPDCEYEIEVDGSVANSGKNTAYLHSGLQPNTYHIYKIRTKPEEATTDWNVVLTLSTLPLPPGAPVIIDSTASNNVIQIYWKPVEGALSYDVEVDGVLAANIHDTTYIHENLVPGTAHQYRVRARTLTDVSPWSEILEKSTISSTYNVNCTQGEEFEFSALAFHVQDFTGSKFIITYNTEELELVDLCGFTPAPDLMAQGQIPGTNLSVSFKPGIIEFTTNEHVLPGSSWSGELSSVRFKAKKDCTTSIHYDEVR